MGSRVIKASFREIALTERKLFSNSACLMPISVGQPVHEHAKFAAVIKLINTSFKHCTILIDDSIQRHTMAILNHLPPEELYKRALEDGEAWLERNKSIYSQLTISYELMRWDDWYQHPHYLQSHSLVQQEYASNEFFRNSYRQQWGRMWHGYQHLTQHHPNRQEYYE